MNVALGVWLLSGFGILAIGSQLLITWLCGKYWPGDDE